MVTVSALHLYPVKSCRGIASRRLALDRFGFRDDRRWMLIDGTGRFQTQRWCQSLALVNVELVDDGALVWRDGEAPVLLPRGGGDRVSTAVFDDAVTVESCGPLADRWATRLVGEPARAVYFPDSGTRVAEEQGFPHPALADLSPVLLIGEASLQDLNRRLESPVPMNRFRPNIVISGSDAYGEDGWSTFTIGGIGFERIRRCVRCRIPTVDQATAVAGKEPSRTLATYRRTDDGVVFGINVAHLGPGVVHVGDSLVPS